MTKPETANALAAMVAGMYQQAIDKGEQDPVGAVAGAMGWSEGLVRQTLVSAGMRVEEIVGERS